MVSIKEKKVFLIINLGYIGDVINASPVCSKIKEKNPNSKILFLTVPSSKEAAKCIPEVDEVIVFDRYGKHKGLKILLFALKLRLNYTIDYALILNENFRSALFAFLCGAKKRIGRSNEGRDFLLSNTIPFTNEEKNLNVHVIEQYMRILKPINLYDDNFKMSFAYTDLDSSYIEDLLSQHNIKDKILIGFCPATGTAIKNWQLEEALNFINLVNKVENHKIVIVGTKECQKFAEDLKNLGCHDFIDLSCKTTLPQLGALISNFYKFVTIDTGPMHIAFALNVPSICLFFQDNYKKWGPMDKNNNLLLCGNQKNTNANEVFQGLNL